MCDCATTNNVFFFNKFPQCFKYLDQNDRIGQSTDSMFQRKNAVNLPTASPSASYGGASSIRIGPTASEAMKNASGETKFTYVSLVISIVLVVWGWRHASYNTYTNVLDCNSEVCTLSMRTVGHQYDIIEGIPRNLLISTEVVRVDKAGEVSSAEPWEPSYGSSKTKGRKSKKKKKRAAAKKQDNFSYSIDFNIPVTMERRKVVMSNFPGAGRSRSRARKQMNKINSYIKGSRDSLNIKESVSFTWQSILALVFGFFFFILTLLIGQFIEPRYIYNKAKVRAKHLSKLGSSKRKF